MPRFPIRLAGSIVALAAAVAGPPAIAQERPRTLATIGMIGDVAASIAGPCLDVKTMIGAGSDPHLYRATPADVRAIEQADVIFFLGLGLEGQLGQVLSRFAARKPVVEIGTVFDPAAILAEEGQIDPHLWMYPGLWASVIAPLQAALTEAAPNCGGDIATRANAMAAQFDAVDIWARDSIASIPEDHRILVTAHDAFGYFGRAYGLAVVAIQGISTESEASVADIAETAKLVAESQVPAVFVESTINPRTIDAMISAVRERGHDVTVGGELYADAMGDDGTPEGTYIGMIHANVTAVVTALGGTVAPMPPALAEWAATWGIDG